MVYFMLQSSQRLRAVISATSSSIAYGSLPNGFSIFLASLLMAPVEWAISWNAVEKNSVSSRKDDLRGMVISSVPGR